MDTITSPPSNINPDSAPTGPSIIPASIPPTDQAPYTTTVIGNTAPNLEPQHITSAPYRSQFDEQPFTYTTTYTTTGPTYTTHSMAPPTSSQMQVTSAQFNPPPPSTTTAAPIGSSHASVIPPAATTTMPPTVTYVQSSQYSCPHCHGPLPDSMFRTHKKSKGKTQQDLEKMWKTVERKIDTWLEKRKQKKAATGTTTYVTTGPTSTTTTSTYTTSAPPPHATSATGPVTYTTL